MASEVNRFNLKRYIEAPLQRQIRQECFNGCVICGRLPYTYEHFDPPFKDARVHDVDGIALLCPNCHSDKTSGRLSSQRVKKARLAPFNKDRPAIWQTHMGESPLLLRIGTNEAVGFGEARINFNNEPLFGARMPSDGDDWLFTGRFSDQNGDEIIEFENNEVIVRQGVWDFELSGKILVVRSSLRVVVARMTFDADRNLVSIDDLHMCVDRAKEIVLKVHKGELQVLRRGAKLLTIAGHRSVSTVVGKLTPLSLELS